MQKIGFSNGALYTAADVTMPETLKQMLAVAPGCVEIFTHNAPGRMGLSEDACVEARKFSRRSIHATTHVRYGQNTETKIILDQIAKLYADINAELVVVHPDVVDDWSIFGEYPMLIGVENMDNRKASYRDVESMRLLFAEHDRLKMVLDLNHCFANDSSMKLAGQFIEALGDRVAQIHLSGFDGYHVPLFKTKQLEILEYCRKLSAPIVIESVLSGIEDLKTEFDYIVGNLL